MLNKSLLEQYPDLVKEIRNQTEGLENLRDLQESTKDSKTNAAIAELAALLVDNTRNSIELAREIEKEVSAIDDAKIREVLRMRYLDGVTWREIGDIFDMEPASVMKAVRKYYS